MTRFDRNNWALREDGVDVSLEATEKIMELFEMAMDGKIVEIGRPTAKAIMKDLIEEVYRGGLLVGFTYYPEEMRAYFGNPIEDF